MDKSRWFKHEKGLYRIYWICVLLGVIWTSVVGIFCFFAIGNQKETALRLSTLEAYTSYDKDLTYLKWSSIQKGTYVPVTDISQPVPDLKHVEERDLVTPAGRRLTLLNPSDMIRQAHELTEKQKGIKSRILNPDSIRSRKEADSWEADAFRSFKTGDTEHLATGVLDGKEYLRLMKPLYAEESCLKCHSGQGYSEGDLMGAISISVPMEPYNIVKTSTSWIILVAYLIIWIMGLFVLTVTFYLLKKQYNRLLVTEGQLRFQAKLLDTVEQSVIATDTEGKILYWNPYSEKLYGWKSNEVNGHYLVDVIIPEEDTAEALKAHKNVRKGGHLSKEINVRNQSGDIFPALITASPVYNEKNDITGVISILIDLTEKKKLEAQLQHTQKMEGLGTLAGGIAHDFNNILSPIMLHSQMAINDLPPGSTLQADMTEIFKATKRARDLVKQILTFARKGKDKRIILHASPVIEEVVNFLRLTIPATINIRYKNRAKHDSIFAHPTQLNQIVMNLCTNSLQAMKDDGGIIDIGLDDEEIKSNENNTLKNLLPGQYLRLTVKDNGTGIPSEIISKIFEPYFTTKGAGKGSGLGLAITHGIVKNYEGDISVESSFEGGTVFTLYFPLIIESAEVLAESETQIEKGTEHILFVDDEKPAVTVMVKTLSRLGYSASATTDSLEALETFRNDPDSFDLLITDMTMPGMTGEKLIHEIKKIRPDLPVILYTGFSDQIDEEDEKLAGIDAFLMKPVSVNDIASAIRKALDK